MDSKTAYIVAAKRSAVGSFGGALAGMAAPEITAQVIEGLADKKTLEEVGEVILGNVLSAGIGQNPARIAASLAGIPHSVPAMTINQVCGSGLRSVMFAAESIVSGRNQLVLAGGMENMSRAPFLAMNHRFGNKLGDDKLVDSMVSDGLWCSLSDQHMGCTTETLAKVKKITRKRMDKYALQSHQRAIKATMNNRFKDEIVPIELEDRKKGKIIFEVDEGPRADTSWEALARLKPVFAKDGLVTAGNASTINDGGAGGQRRLYQEA
jgi:acetyl-CoA C-acetyltransferase